MGTLRRYTIGAVAPDFRSLADLNGRIEGLGHLAVLVRRRDEKLVSAAFPEACVERVPAWLSRRQGIEFFSTFFSASTVSFLMGAVHLPTGLAVQGLLTVSAIFWLIFLYTRPRLQRQLLGMGLPENVVGGWSKVFPRGFALALLSIPEEVLDEAQSAFLADGDLLAPLAVGRRLVL